MARRKNRGASFANRKTDESAAEKRKKEQQTTLLYSAIGLAAILALCFIIYLVYRPSSSASTGNESAATTAEGSAADTTANDAAVTTAEESGAAADADGLEGAASVAPAERNNYYDAAPEMGIDTSKSYEAIIKTDKGDMRFQLFTEEAPVTVNNFVFLAREGFYDDTMFHRVIDSFMAQGGDPTGTGTGGPGYRFEDEVDNDLAFDRRGLLAMANSGPATNGSQFFITFAPTPHLTGLHTIYGEIIEGDDVLASLSIRDPRESTPGDVINSIEIIEN